MHYLLMPLQRYFDFNGRSRRAEYWPWTLTLLVINLGLFGVNSFLRGLSSGIPSMVVWAWLIVTLAPSISVTVRRFHDTNRTGWWALYAFVAPILAFQATFFYFVQNAHAMAGAMAVSVSSLFVAAFVIALGLLIVLALPTLIFLIQDGTPRNNRFGTDPKRRDTANIF